MKTWLISDPHGMHGFLDIPLDVEMVICAGDVGNAKEPHMNANQVLDFIEWFDSLQHK